LNILNRTIRIRTPIKIQVDEQYSRSQRNDSAASFSTAVFISKVDEIDKIIHLSHTSSNEATQQQIECKAKTPRNSELDFLAKNLKSIHTMIMNGCSSGTKSINDYVRPFHPNVNIQHMIFGIKK
jgi:hypothetical protein